jgi:hypothetical protein
MLRRLLWCSLAALALVPTALAAGPSPGVSQSSEGVGLPEGSVRYVTLRDGAGTMLSAVRERDGHVLRATSLTASWGIPLVAFDGTSDGLSGDGQTLVLADASQQTTPLRAESRLLVVDTKTLRSRALVKLRGDFTFDALSPHGTTLYLVQHLSTADISRYVVRAYDLAQGRLLKRVIADRTQRGWVMQGYPMARVTSPDGRMAYTLYQNPGGYPFIHALDTVRGTAHCIGIPWHGKQDGLSKLRLSLVDGGRRLALGWPGGRTFITVNTRTYRLSRPATAGGGDFPWWAVAVGATAVAVALGRGVIRQRNSEGPPDAPTM